MNGTLRIVPDGLFGISLLLMDRCDEIGQDGAFVACGLGGLVTLHELLQNLIGLSLGKEHVGADVEPGDVILSEFFVEPLLVMLLQPAVFGFQLRVSGIGGHSVIEGVVDVVIAGEQFVREFCRVDLRKVFLRFDIHSREDIPVCDIEHGVEFQGGGADPVSYLEFLPGIECGRIEVVLVIFVEEVVVDSVTLDLGASGGDFGFDAVDVLVFDRLEAVAVGKGPVELFDLLLDVVGVWHFRCAGREHSGQEEDSDKAFEHGGYFV